VPHGIEALSDGPVPTPDVGAIRRTHVVVPDRPAETPAASRRSSSAQSGAADAAAEVGAVDPAGPGSATPGVTGNSASSRPAAARNTVRRSVGVIMRATVEAATDPGLTAD
jgi:hypothetical protein